MAWAVASASNYSETGNSTHCKRITPFTISITDGGLLLQPIKNKKKQDMKSQLTVYKASAGSGKKKSLLQANIVISKQNRQTYMLRNLVKWMMVIRNRFMQARMEF